MPPANKQSQKPSSSPAEAMEESPLALRERVLTFTDAELDQLMKDVEANGEVAEEVKEQETQEAIEQRMEELKVADDVRARWERLRTTIKNPREASEMEKKAESHFLKQMVDKGGVWAVVGMATISVLAWLGFKNFKNLRESIKNKGYLRTAIEGAREHPILATMIAALGIKVGTEAYSYMMDNRETIEEAVGAYAGETGKSMMEATNDIAEKIGQGANWAKDQSLRGLTRGLAFAFGGKYDEETGVVTLENKLFGGQKTLRPPFIIAWQAGVRADGGTALMKKAYSLFLVEDRFDAIMRQKKLADTHAREADATLFLSAKRGKELLANGVRPGMKTKESRELEQIMDLAIKADPELQKAKPLEIKQATNAELDERLKHVETEMAKLYANEVESFNKTKNEIHNDAIEAERKLNDPAMKGKEEIKQKAVQKMQEDIATYEGRINEKKVNLAHQQADLLNAKASSDLLGEHLKYKLDNTTGGRGIVERGLDRSVKATEATGVKIMRSTGGKWIVGAVSCYSFLPLALEGAAGMRSGKEGEAARKALAYDVGEAVGGFIPGVGEALDFKAAFTGKDLNGRELDTWGRVTAGAMGTLGTASIVAGFFTGGLSIVGFRAVRGALAARKATKIVRLAKQGVNVADASKDTIKAMEAAGTAGKALNAADKAKNSAEALNDMLKISNFQKKARRVQNFVRNGQRAMQLYTYGSLGLQLASGVATIYGNGEAFVNDTFEKAAAGGKAVSEFVETYTPKLPS